MKILEKIMKSRKYKAFVTLITMFALLGVCVAEVVTQPKAEAIEYAGIIGLIVSGLVGVLVAGALLPTIFNQTNVLQADDEIGDTESTLVGLWPLLLVVGVMLAIIGVTL